MFRDRSAQTAVNTWGLADVPKPSVENIFEPELSAVARGTASHSITYRAAAFTDCRELARLICVAGGGLYEFLLGDLVPFVTPANFLAVATVGPRYCISYRNCFVAIDETVGAIIGAANVFPADLLRKENNAVLPFKRRNHIRPLLELQDWGSMFLNALAVNDRHRRRGVGARLLDWAEEQARRAGFDRLSLHAWADNTTALNFYKTRGFVQLAIAGIPYHSRLRHVGGSILMQRKINSR